MCEINFTLGPIQKSLYLLLLYQFTFAQNRPKSDISLLTFVLLFNPTIESWILAKDWIQSCGRNAFEKLKRLHKIFIYCNRPLILQTNIWACRCGKDDWVFNFFKREKVHYLTEPKKSTEMSQTHDPCFGFLDPNPHSLVSRPLLNVRHQSKFSPHFPHLLPTYFHKVKTNLFCFKQFPTLSNSVLHLIYKSSELHLIKQVNLFKRKG